MARREFSQSFGAILRTTRERVGLSQEALAEEAGVHRNYVGMVERGENSVTLDVALHLAEAVGVTLDQLIREATKVHARNRRSTQNVSAPHRRKTKR